MTGHRHATDRKEVVAILGCPNGCQVCEIESEGEDDAVETLIERAQEAFGECSDCGAEMGMVRQEEPSEVLD